jgi:YgiT-type zinc finger domain-containing protein
MDQRPLRSSLTSPFARSCYHLPREPPQHETGELKAVRCIAAHRVRKQSGVTTVTLQRGDMTVVVRDVPAQVCPECGEAWVDEAVAAELLALAEDAVQRGVEIGVRRYTPLAKVAWRVDDCQAVISPFPRGEGRGEGSWDLPPLPRAPSETAGAPTAKAGRVEASRCQTDLPLPAAATPADRGVGPPGRGPGG